MAESGRFGLSLRVLAFLAAAPHGMVTSAAIAEGLDVSPVMVRRTFLTLSRAGFITQRKGPHGGACLKLSPKDIGLGDLYTLTTGKWLTVGDKTLDSLMKRVRDEATAALNETTLAQVVKRLRKA